MVSEKTRSDIIKLTVIWVVLSAIAEFAAAQFIGDYPGTASRQGEITSEAVFFLLWVTIPVFILVALIIAYSMFRFRVADDDEQPSESQYRSGRAFPWGWVAISVVLNVLFIIHPGLTGLAGIWSMAETVSDPIEVDVTARQWGWGFSYPGQELKNAAELVVPVDKPIEFVLRSNDVIHSFWVPAWGIKKAVIPGETRTLLVTPDRILSTSTDPNARVQCSQICGAGHAEMQAPLQVVSLADFNDWVKTTKAAAKEEMNNMNMPGMNMNGSKEMPGMNMNGGESMPGMKMESKGQMPGMDMDNNEEMPGMKMNGGESMPGMEKPEQGTMNNEMPGMDMSGKAQGQENMPGMDMQKKKPMTPGEEMPKEMPMKMDEN